MSYHFSSRIQDRLTPTSIGTKLEEPISHGSFEIKCGTMEVVTFIYCIPFLVYDCLKYLLFFNITSVDTLGPLVLKVICKSPVI